MHLAIERAPLRRLRAALALAASPSSMCDTMGRATARRFEAAFV
eukprot:CAMPEP_0198231860 /NCGR_PEP_ID=MMETSP1445-20131203/115422_1 /TAXON_ID=36898 /ORGANISM="Pyramimonas sp., Strain CCMP2087" /LENGTH=43 /DNA_ID= /DNA_START= /DNA_END= /DNA_ORIENTATION=